MRLKHKCTSCGKENYLKSSYTTRYEVVRDYPEGLPTTCRVCGNLDSVPPNKIRAEENKVYSLIGVLGIVGGILLGVLFLIENWTGDLGADLYILMVFGGIIVLPPAITGLLVRTERKKASMFNKHFV